MNRICHVMELGGRLGRQQDLLNLTWFQWFNTFWECVTSASSPFVQTYHVYGYRSHDRSCVLNRWRPTCHRSVETKNGLNGKLTMLIFYVLSCEGRLMDTRTILTVVTLSVFSVHTSWFKPHIAVNFRVLNSIIQVRIIKLGS